MSLIPLTMEYSNGSVSFANFPSFTNGFFRFMIFVSVTTSDDATLTMEVNGAGPGHWFNNTMVSGGGFVPPAPGTFLAEHGSSVVLATGRSGQIVFNSEVVIALCPEGNLISARCGTSQLTHDGSGNVMQVFYWPMSAARTGYATLDSVTFRVLDGASPATDAVGTARLLAFPHISGLQLEIT